MSAQADIIEACERIKRAAAACDFEQTRSFVADTTRYEVPRVLQWSIVQLLLAIHASAAEARRAAQAKGRDS